MININTIYKALYLGSISTESKSFRRNSKHLKYSCLNDINIDSTVQSESTVRRCFASSKY